MSRRTINARPAARRSQALIFSALGDTTRLALITRLYGGRPHSISQLTRGFRLTRQAVTKHLHVLESAGLVRSVHSGRESLFEFDPEPIRSLRGYLDFVSQQWDQALSRLKSFVEE